MKAEDLMIGDWVNLGETYIQIQVNAIYGDYIEWGAEHLESIEDIKPLPLTAEILEKNGFHQNGITDPDFDWYNAENIDDTYVFQEGRKDKDSVTISIYLDFSADICMVEIESFKNKIDELQIKYVHELQHALKMCGIEKEIVL